MLRCSQAGHNSFVVALAVVPAGVNEAVPGLGIVSGGRDTTARLWDVDTAAEVSTLAAHQYQVNAVGVMPTGEIVTGGLDGLLKVWKAGVETVSAKEHEGPILCMAVLQNGTLLTGELLTPCDLGT